MWRISAVLNVCNPYADSRGENRAGAPMAVMVSNATTIRVLQLYHLNCLKAKSLFPLPSLIKGAWGEGGASAERSFVCGQGSC
jgi:hypothetical protein